MTKKKDQQDCSLHFCTKVISLPFATPDAHGAITMPIYRNAAFEFADAESIANAFQSKGDAKHTYTRISNPTVAHLEQKIQAVSGANHVHMLSSGMAAISNVFFNIAYAGSNIVTSPHLFGNTFSFFCFTLANFGVEVRFVDTDDINAIEAAIDDNTVAFFCELITNPHMEVADLTRIKPLLKKHHVPLIVDSTLIPWCGFDGKRFGVDIEVVSSTKYISGGATALGGVILDYGYFDWSGNPVLKSFLKDSKISPFSLRLKGEVARNLGACMDADAAYMQSIGMETLELRYERMSESAWQLATFLEQQEKVKHVGYTALDSSPYKKISDKLFSHKPGAMLTFRLESAKHCYAFINSLRLVRRSTNLFDNKTLIIHPYSTIYGTFSEEAKQQMGIVDTELRLSVGLENVEDIKQDLLGALANI